jgi:hypothetical protein
MATGDMYTQEEVDAMSVVQRAQLKLVRLNSAESATLEGMNRKQRRDWMRKNKMLSRRKRNVQATAA